ncbi:MAG: M28 family peptidase [Rectinemataceae bacterium]
MQDFSAIDAERIFMTVKDIQGVKHPTTAPAALDACADRIARDMGALGLKVREQRFLVPGFPLEFRNIEGSLGPVDSEPAAVVVAHYDTVATTLGANDDAIGIATMLEIARVLAALPEPPPVYFVAVSLEEENPAMFAAEHGKLRELGLVGESGAWTGWAVAKAAKEFQAAARNAFMGGMDYGDAWRNVLAEAAGKDAFGPAGGLAGAHGGKVAATLEDVLSCYRSIIPNYEGITTANAPGLLNRIGSDRWVRDALARGLRIAFNITLDEIGTCNHEPGSQKSLGGINLYPLLAQSHRVDPARASGDWSLVLADGNSGALGRLFMEKVSIPGIDLPSGFLQLPQTFDQIAREVPMALNSDHANFWRHGIPAIFIFDTSTGRNPFCHSMADSVEVLDYDYVRSIAQAVAATVADPAARAGR